jgi:ESS family glutamate:Na+ symporter
MVTFFTCIGLNATWDLVRRGGMDVGRFLVLGSVFAILQNVLGVVLAKALGQSPLLGLVCGSVTLTGGHGTALGFAPMLQNLGLPSAAVLGTAAATMGVVAGGLIGGPVATRLMDRHGLHATKGGPVNEGLQGSEPGILSELRLFREFGGEGMRHLLLILLCVKAGAWMSFLLEATQVKFPPQMGAMIVGVIVRNVMDQTGHRWIRYEIVDLVGAIALGLFLTVAMISLNLMDLANAAGPMVVIIAAQIALMAAFAYFVTYQVMGRDYDAAVMAAGHCGFGLGATSNAIATMKSLVVRHGPAPRAFLVIPVVGGILIDFVNALNITVFANLLK